MPYALRDDAPLVHTHVHTLPYGIVFIGFPDIWPFNALSKSPNTILPKRTSTALKSLLALFTLLESDLKWSKRSGTPSSARPRAPATMNGDDRYDNYELELRLKAIVSLLHNAERQGLRISRDAQDIIEHECMSLFEHDKVPIDRLKFAALLKDTAVRMFRQRRYAEADSRYRMASLFNTRDVTLVSNRATCMYNLKRFERCIDLCYACMMSFPTLCFENTLLYLKLIVRLGHAKIELHNYADARKTFRSLSHLRKHLEIKCGIDIEDDDFQAMTMPFQKHLEAAIETYHRQNPGKPISDLSKRQTPYELGINGYLRENRDVGLDMGPEEYVDEVLHYDDESDDDGGTVGESVDDNTVGTVEVAHLCCHVWSEGTGPCQHMFPEEGRANAGAKGKRNDGTQEESDTSLDRSDSGDGDDDDDDDDSDDQGKSGTDEDMPDLLTCDPDDDDSETGDESDSSVEASRKKAVRFSDRKKKSTESRVVKPGKSAQIGSASNGKETLASALEKKRRLGVTLAEINERLNAHTGQKSTPPKKGFKKGFLDSSRSKSNSNETTEVVARSTSSSVDSGPAKPSTTPTSVILYETDEEDGPVSGTYSAGTVDDAVKDARNVFPLLEDDGVDRLDALVCDVLGRKFRSGVAVDTIDFTALFGEHHAPAKSGKKKKRGCDKRCGPCFARKMWKTRFTNRVVTDFEHHLNHLDEDPRVDQDTFLGVELWQSIGYYGSGHELAFEIPAIVHGAAYIALLQSELRWRGDSFAPTMDIQQMFLRALEKNLTTSLKGFQSLFMVILMLRDTLTLFDVLSDHKSRGLTCSFQFAKTASAIARNARQTAGPSAVSEAERQASLMTRYDDCVQNMNNWGILGHIEQEEVRVYKFLLKDVTGLLMNVTSRITASPKPRGQSETFTEAFRRLCGDRSDDESQWKHRIVSAMCKQRCRVIERKSASRKANDLSRSALLLTRAITARPSQPRLYYKRADVYAHQDKWGDCVRDLQRTRMLLGEQITVKQTIELLDPAQKLLLLHAYTLEGEAHGAQGRKPGRDQRNHVRLGIEYLSKALEVTPKSKRTKASLQKKLRALQSLAGELSRVARPASQTNGSDKEAMRSSTAGNAANRGAASSMVTADSQLRKARETAMVQPVSNDGDVSDSSSDEEAGDQVAGNPYAALLEKGASSSSQSSAGPSGHPQNCELCDVAFSSAADYDSHMNGKRHKGMVSKARKRGLLPEANGTYSAPGNRLGPTRNEVVEQVCQIIASQGGQAKLSEIMNRLNFRRWKIRDAGKYVDNTFGGMFSVCMRFSYLFQVGAGSSADPVLRLRKASPNVAGPVQLNRRDIGKTAVQNTSTEAKMRLSETGDFSQMVTDLLKIGNGKDSNHKSDEEECGICLDNEPDVRCWPCGHVWCDSCMQLYLAKKGTNMGVECPKCRGTIETLHRIAVD